MNGLLEKTVHPERYCVKPGCLAYRPCPLHDEADSFRADVEELASVKRIGATPLSAAEIKEGDEIAIRHEIESGSSQARFAILDAYYAGLARAKADRQVTSPLTRQQAKWKSVYERFEEAITERNELHAQNAELLAALRVCMEAIDTAHADPEAGLPSPAWHWWKAARDAIAKAEATP